MIFAILLHIDVFEIPILYIGKFAILVSYGQPGNFYIQPCQILICDIENFEYLICDTDLPLPPSVFIILIPHIRDEKLIAQTS